MRLRGEVLVVVRPVTRNLPLFAYPPRPTQEATGVRRCGTNVLRLVPTGPASGYAS